jgi:hypothetical protein
MCTFGQIAVSLTEFGVRVLPLIPGKTDLHLPARADLEEPSYFPTRVKRVWSEYTECGVALATGFYPESGRGVIAIELDHTQGPGALLPPPMLPKTLTFSPTPGKTLLLYWVFGRVKRGKVNKGVWISGENCHVPIDPDLVGEGFWRRPWPSWREVAPAPNWVYVPQRLRGVARPTYLENCKEIRAGVDGRPAAPFWRLGVWRLGEAPLAILRLAIDRRFEGGDREAVVSEALTLNAENCIPPLPEGEVRAIAEWVCDHLPPNPDVRGPEECEKMDKTFPLWKLYHAF